MLKRSRSLLLIIQLIVALFPQPKPPVYFNNSNNPAPTVSSGGSAFVNIDASGAYSSSIPIVVPLYHGLEPNLNLNYNSHSGNGWLGVGISLGGVSNIQRVSPGRGSPHYDGSDMFLIDGMELIRCTSSTISPSCLHPATTNYIAFTSKVDSFQRIAYDPKQLLWYIWDKLGEKTTYYPRAYLASAGPYAWDLGSVEDTLGNKVTYNRWQDETASGFGETYLDSISYNGTLIKFYYELRPDVIKYGVGYDNIEVRYRIKTIDITVNNSRARTYQISYDVHPGSYRSVIKKMQEYGSDAVLNSSGDILSGTSYPPIQFGYTTAPDSQNWTAERIMDNDPAPGWDGVMPASIFSGRSQEIEQPWSETFHTGDIDGDGRWDALYQTLTGLNQMGHESPILHFESHFADNRIIETSLPLPNRLSGYFSPINPPQDGRADLVKSWTADVNGDGRSDLILMSWAAVETNKPSGLLRLLLDTVISQGDGQFRPGSDEFQYTDWVTSVIQGGQGPLSALGPNCQPGDINGDELADFACLYTENKGRQFLGAAISRGDGSFDLSHAPILIADDPGTVPDDWSIPFTGVLPFETRSISLGDVNMDGLDDLEILDLRPNETQACPIEDLTNCTIHIDLLTGVSNGDGTFIFDRTQTDWLRRITNLGESVFAADLNGDGRSDYLLLASSLTDHRDIAFQAIQTAIRLPDGSYDFHEQTTPQLLQDRQVNFTLGDANGDGLVDLLVVAPMDAGTGVHCSSTINYKHLILTRVLSNGNGTFKLPARWDNCRVSQELNQNWSNIRISAELQAADTNGDGLADFMNSFASILPNNKASFGVFDNVSKASGLDTQRWISADVTGDGRDDLIYITSQTISAYIYTLIRLPKGNYEQKKTAFPIWKNSALRSWKTMDVNGDGKADLVHIQCLYPFIFPPCLTDIDTYLAKGDGTFDHKPRTSSMWIGATSNVSEWRPMDINGDGKGDLVQLTYMTLGGGGLFLKTFLSNGDGSWIEQRLKGPFTWTQSRFTPEPGSRAQDTRNWWAADINGDGKTDLVRTQNSGVAIEIASLLSKGQGDWDLQTFAESHGSTDGWGNISATEATIHWRVGDVNGDGKTDLFHLAKSGNGLRVHTLLSNGNGMTWQKHFYDPVFPQIINTNTLYELLNWKWIDANGDGRSDLVQVVRTKKEIQITGLRSTGAGEWLAMGETLPDPGFIGNRYMPSWSSADNNGDGKQDMTRVDISPFNPPHLYVSSLLSAAPLDLLYRESRGGGTVIIKHAPSSGFPVNGQANNCFLPVGLVVQVVSSVIVWDGRGPDNSASYNYECARWSHANRTFLGWTDVSTNGTAAINHPETIIKTRYRLTDECLSQLQDIAFFDKQGHYYASRDLYAYNNPGSSAPYNCLTLYHNHLEYGGGGGMAQNNYTYYQYDSYGNLKNIFEYGDPTIEGDERTTSIIYHPADQPYLVGLPWEVTVGEGVLPVKNTLRFTYFCYDGDNGTDSTNCSGQPKKGLLTATQAVDDKGLYVTTTYQHDNYGNVQTIQYPNKSGLQIWYDPTYHIYPTTIIQPLVPSTNITWDTTLGLVLSRTELNQTTTYSYDALGRSKVTTFPSGAKSEREYQDWGNPTNQHIRERVTDGTNDGLWRESYFDGLGRIYRLVLEGDKPGLAFIQYQVYSDSTDQVYQVSHWYESDQPNPIFESIAYDGAGRVLTLTHPDGTSYQWDYGIAASGPVTLWFDELGHEKAVYTDAYGRIIQIREKNEGKADHLVEMVGGPLAPGSNSCVDIVITSYPQCGTTAWDKTCVTAATGCPAGWQYSSTNYTYDAADDLRTVTDDKGNVMTYTWDILGQLRSMSDPDLGNWTYKYDVAGNLREQTDSRNNTIKFTYDALTRIKTKEYPDGRKWIWNYDEIGHGLSWGKLTSVSDPTGTLCGGLSEEFQYDSLGRLQSYQKCIDGQSSTFTYEYDSLTRLKKLIYPDGEEVTYNYDSAGRILNMPNLVRRFLYNPEGQLTNIEYENGTSQALTYDPLRNWLKESSVSFAGNILYQSGYQYRPDGLIRSSNSATNKNNFIYTYDDLDHLSKVTGDINEELRYDSLGNITFKSDVGQYFYPTTGSNICGTTNQHTGPHTALAAGSWCFQYDRNGNLKSIVDNNNSNPSSNRSFEWNFDNQPSFIVDGSGTITVIRYDAWGNQIYRQRAGETTYSFGRLMNYSVSSTSGQGDITKYYYAGSMLIARRDSMGLYWYHQDLFGSPRLITDRNGSVASRHDYKPFGELLNNGTITNNGINFTGHQGDKENGLIDMNARFYEPHSGRFISGDPTIPDIYNPQALNRYSYAYNSPTSYVDIKGYDPIFINGKKIETDIGLIGPLQPVPKGFIETGGIFAQTEPESVVQQRYERTQLIDKYLKHIGWTWDQALAFKREAEYWEYVNQGVANIGSGVPGVIGYIIAGERGAALGANIGEFGAAAPQVASAVKAKFSTNPSGPYIGSSGNTRPTLRKSPFNPNPKDGNCLQCVTKLVDSIVNQGMDDKTIFPPFANGGYINKSLNYITEYTGVTFGGEQQGTLIGPPNTDFVVFTKFTKEGNTYSPGHVLWGSNRGGTPYFYDPQSGGNKIQFESMKGEFFVSYPINYPP